MAVGNKAEGGRDGENQACKRPGRARDGAQQDRAKAKAGVDFEATREGEETPEQDLRDRADNYQGNTEATREGEDPELDLGIRRNKEATREGEENPKQTLRNHEDIEATRCKTPVTTKEEENPGRGGGH